MSADRPLACDLAALSPTEQARRSSLLLEWSAFVIASDEVADGIAYTVPARGSVVQLLVQFVTLERRCCPFLRFEMKGERGDTMVFRVTGPPGTSEFLRAEGLPG